MSSSKGGNIPASQYSQRMAKSGNAADAARSDGYPSDWPERRREILRRDAYRCQYCGIRSTRADDIALDVDHIIPKSRGGSHELSNLRALCPECHAERHPQNEKLRTRSNKWSGGFLHDVWQLFYTRYLTDRRTISIDKEGRTLVFDPVETIPHLGDAVAITIRATVKQLWSHSSEKIAQSGIIVPTDESDSMLESPIKFVCWKDAGVRRLHENQTYIFVGAKTNEYNDEIQLSIDNRTEILVPNLMRRPSGLG